MMLYVCCAELGRVRQPGKRGTVRLAVETPTGCGFGAEGQTAVYWRARAAVGVAEGFCSLF